MFILDEFSNSSISSATKYLNHLTLGNGIPRNTHVKFNESVSVTISKPSEISKSAGSKYNDIHYNTVVNAVIIYKR